MTLLLRRLALIATGLLISIQSFATTQAKMQLPADFIFQTKGIDGHWYLVRVNAQSGQWTLFYAKKGSDVGLINWSPLGDKVAIFQSDAHGTQLCVLTRDAKLISCMDNEVGQIAFFMIWGNGAGGNSYLYKVGWSPDEHILYYITDTPKVGQSAAFLAGDVATGRTLGTLYNQPDLDAFTGMPSPNSPDLLLRTAYSQNTLINTADFVEFQKGELPINNGTLQTFSRKNLIVQFDRPVNDNLSTPENVVNNPSVHTSNICGFSPQGTYLTRFDSAAVNLSSGQSPYEWDALDNMGNIAYRMAPPSYPDTLIPVGCVAWAPNETHFFARKQVKSQIGDSIYVIINRYDLEQAGQVRITPFFTEEGILDPYTGPWEVLPDGNYILYEEACGQDDGCDLATIIGPNNLIERFPGINGISAHPLWIPPLIADVIVPASPTPVGSTTPPPSATSNGASVPGSNQIGGG